MSASCEHHDTFGVRSRDGRMAIWCTDCGVQVSGHRADICPVCVRSSARRAR